MYANVSGKNIALNSPDFPEFTNAIEASIRNPDGWCHKKLIKKMDEFSHEGQGTIEETYLRITLGENLGWSPGIPMVLEIWPPGHHSPIHNHGDTNAIIRVLHGEIMVSLYPMLSYYHQNPFAQRIFKKDDLTWITPGLNQTHRLENPNLNGPTCITLQCYMYGKDNDIHYEYFDYLGDESPEFGQYFPDSDMGFDEFKELMRAEWLGDIRQENWQEYTKP